MWAVWGEGRREEEEGINGVCLWMEWRKVYHSVKRGEGRGGRGGGEKTVCFEKSNVVWPTPK